LHSLSSKASDFISNFQWDVPVSVQAAFQNTNQMVNQVIVPSAHKEGKMVWNLSNSNDLTFEDDFLRKLPHGQAPHRAKTIWNVDIPPSTSLLALRLMHDKLLTDENLMSTGCIIPSIYNNCLSNLKLSFHLFFDCSFSFKI